MALSTEDIRIGDAFEDDDGRFLGYDAYDLVQREALPKQRHRDIRVFSVLGDVQPYDMETLSTLTMDELNVLSMTALTTGDRILYDEKWAGSAVVGPITSAKWPGLTAAETDAINTHSHMSASVDIWTGFTDSDLISLTLPDCQATLIDNDLSLIRFYSGGPDLATATEVMWGPDALLGLPHLTDPWPVTDGHHEVRIPRSLLWPNETPAIREARLRSITGIHLHVRHASPGVTLTFKCAAIRIISPEWVLAPLDIDTQTARVRRGVPRNGDPAQVPAFPSNTIVDPLVPTSWPILFRADAQAGHNDPRPIDLTHATIFNTGSMTASGDIRLYFREAALDLISQIDLEGDTMAMLDALGVQPDFGLAEYLARTQAALDAETQAELDGVTQLDLGRTPDFLSAAWVQVRLTWANATSSSHVLEIRDTEGTVRGFPLSLQGAGLLPFGQYVLACRLEDTTVHAWIEPLSLENRRLGGAPTMDVSVTDDGLLSRRSGRVGWWAGFTDGDAYIDETRAYEHNFAEYRSHPLQSITPVSGAQLFYGGSNSREGFVSLTSYRGSEVSDDPTKSASGAARKVVTNGASTRQGIITNLVEIDSFAETIANFDVFLPSGADATLEAFITDVFGNRFALNVGQIQRDRWHSVEVSFADAAGEWLPGRFALSVGQQGIGNVATWWIDNISIRQPSLVWSARAHDADPWGDDNTPWVPFREAVNANTAGVLFERPGKALQARAFARQPTASLTSVKLLPRYASLGRLVWPNPTDTINTLPDPTLPLWIDIGGPSPSGGVYTYPDGTVSAFVKALPASTTFTAIVNIDPSSPHQPALYEWDFGNGRTLSGPAATSAVVDYTGVDATTLRVSLCLTTVRGLKVCVGKQLIF